MIAVQCSCFVFHLYSPISRCRVPVESVSPDRGVLSSSDPSFSDRGSRARQFLQASRDQDRIMSTGEGNSRNSHQLLRRGWQIPCSLSPCSCFNNPFFMLAAPSAGASLDLEKHGMNFSSLSLLPSPASSTSSLILVRWGSGSLIHEHARCIHPTKTSCD